MANFSFRLSPVATRVEKATSRHLVGPDWAVNMGICDTINSDQRQAKDAVKAIKKRLQHKKPKTQFLTLVLLETVMKNCGDYVHQQVIERNILQEMIKIVERRTEMQVRDKILELLDSWQEAFGGPGGKYPQYHWAHTELRRSGMSFPQRSLDNPPIFTPPAHSESTSAQPQVGYGVSNNTSTRLGEGMTYETGNLSVLDLKHIQTVMELLSDMMHAINPRDPVAARDDAITDLVSQCRSNQKRLVQLLNSTGDEELLRKGIEINDNLQSLLAKHDAMAAGTFLPPEVSKTVPKEKKSISAPVVNNQFEDEEDDDEFSQLARRNSKFTAKRNNSMDSSNTFSPNWSDAPPTATNTSSTSESSSSWESKALVLLDPPAPVQTRKEEPDMIDLLSLTLKTTSESSPHPVTVTSASNQQVFSTSATPSGQGNLYSPQPYPTSQGFNPYNSYVAPWAQNAVSPLQQQFSLQPQPSQYPYSYPNPQWAASSVPSNPIPSSTYQWAPSHVNYISTPQHNNSFGTSANYTPPFDERQGGQKLNKEKAPIGHSNSLSLKKATVGGELEQNSNMKQTVPQAGYASRPLQSYSSFPSNTAPTVTGATLETINLKHTGAAISQKPYYHPDSLFGDLIDLKSSGGRTNLRSKSTLATPGQPMINSRQ